MKSYPKLDELVLPNSKLRFCADQLQNLNFLFNAKIEKTVVYKNEKLLKLAKSVSERLVQRLLCCAGEIDARFASKYLIFVKECLEKQTLEYYVRLDSLSSPSLYQNEEESTQYEIIECDPEYPAGYARLRFFPKAAKTWQEYINSAGYLRRDKIQARLAELLAKSIAMFTPDSPLQVDESSFCGIPGKIIDPIALHHILQIPTNEQVFYGPSGSVPRFPDPRDFRIAIVDEPDGIRLRIEFLSPALSNICIYIRLLVSIGLDFWPSTSNFPARVALGHVDFLLYQKAAQTGMYLVGYGVQSSAWQIRVPSAETTILNHYGPNSVVTTILDVLNHCLTEIRKIQFRSGRSRQLSFDILNHFIIKTALLRELESNSCLNPSSALVNWSPMYLSKHVLTILDKLILHLKEERLSNYFFASSNLLVNPGHLSDDDFVAESQKIRSLLLRFFDESLVSMKGNEEFRSFLAAQNSEVALLTKWIDIVEGLLPPKRNRFRSKLGCGVFDSKEVRLKFSKRQEAYIQLIIKNMVEVDGKILMNSETSTLEKTLIAAAASKEPPIEDAIYLLAKFLDNFIYQYYSNPKFRQKSTKKSIKTKAKCKEAASKLIETCRKDSSNTTNISDEDLIKILIGWLQNGLRSKALRPVLRYHLDIIFKTSHSASWYLEQLLDFGWKKELDALRVYARLMNSGDLTPAQGLIDAYNKKWIWAKNMLEAIEKGSLRVVLVPEKGKVVRHILSLPQYGKKTRKGDKDVEERKHSNTLPARNCFWTILRQGTENGHSPDTPHHDILKLSSPMTSILDTIHRRGDHRCCGDIFRALLSIQKINILTEASKGLPDEDQVRLLETVHGLSVRTKKGRSSAEKRWSATLPQPRTDRKHSTDAQKYVRKEESAGVSLGVVGNGKEKSSGEENVDSIIKKVREVRLKQGSVFKVDFSEGSRTKKLFWRFKF